MTATTLNAGDTQNLTSLLPGNDGTLDVVVGPVGSKVTALRLSAVGRVLQLVPQSMIRLNTGNGYGSVNTFIRRFLNIVTSQGGDITYTDSPTLGGYFTINTDGVYTFSYSDCFNLGTWMGLSLNSGQLTTAITGITQADVLMVTNTIASGQNGSLSATVYLTAGSVVRAHTAGGIPSGSIVPQFIAVKVA